MSILLMLCGVTVLLEIVTYCVGRWPVFRSALAALASFGNISAAIAVCAYSQNVFSIVLGFLFLYRALNMLRIIKHKMNEEYLRKSTRQTGASLFVAQILAALGWIAWSQWHTTGHDVWAVAASAQVVLALLLLLFAVRNLRHMRWPTEHSNYTDNQLPTVTVAIPARNETEDLRLCLESVVASDYPKLEVIVLDDCSQTRRTPEIIRSFAQSGVRFVQGEEPSGSWLAKNRAYERLVEESSGEYILFCGVDVRFEPRSIRNMISVMLDRKKSMISILPRRHGKSYNQFSLLQAARYWWELALPRRQFNRPPVLGTCWLIKSVNLKKLGGFAAVSRMIVPEAYFARELTRADGYSFLRANGDLGVESTKSISDQRETTIRMRYPQMHRRPEQVAVVTILGVFLLLSPLSLAVLGFWVSIGGVAQCLAAVASLLLVVSYMCVVLAARVNAWWFAIVAQPLAVLADIALMNYSMWKYEFSKVEWRGRNVSFPVMHVIPHLPKIQDK